ncbi:MAG: hypothetical protein QME07_06925, partial [bacterium]|nr:hypothetical protein [bacterium]
DGAYKEFVSTVTFFAPKPKISTYRKLIFCKPIFIGYTSHIDDIYETAIRNGAIGGENLRRWWWWFYFVFCQT